MPAAAVIPAPIAYIKVVAVKKLVVGFVAAPAVQIVLVLRGVAIFVVNRTHLTGRSAIYIFYFEKIRVFKAGFCCEYISME